jgi:hypothetical protein
LRLACESVRTGALLGDAAILRGLRRIQFASCLYGVFHPPTSA